MSAEPQTSLGAYGDAVVDFLVAMNAHAEAELARITDPRLHLLVRRFWHSMVPGAVELAARLTRR
jgi:hypothetical protein